MPPLHDLEGIGSTKVAARHARKEGRGLPISDAPILKLRIKHDNGSSVGRYRVLDTHPGDPIAFFGFWNR